MRGADAFGQVIAFRRIRYLGCSTRLGYFEDLDHTRIRGFEHHHGCPREVGSQHSSLVDFDGRPFKLHDFWRHVYHRVPS